AEQTFTITIAAPPGANNAPRIISTPVTTVTAGQVYQYNVSAADPDADVIVFALTGAPAGATVDGFGGSISWTPSAQQMGTQFFTVEAEDGRGGRAAQSFTVDVQPQTAPLPTPTPDIDADGFDESEDCDDTNPQANQAQKEVPGNGTDDDCNPATPDQLPAGALSCSLVTDKRGYSSNSLAQLSAAARNMGAGLTIDGLQAHVTVSDASARNIFTTTFPINTLSPGSQLRAAVPFNTGTEPPGTYQAVLDVRYGSAPVCGAQVSFSILSSAATGRALRGQINATPGAVAQGQTSALAYQVRNVGNEDLPTVNLKVLVVEAAGGGVARTLLDQTALPKGQSFTNTQTFDSTGVAAGDYLVILQGESGGTTPTVDSVPLRITPPSNRPPVARCRDFTRSADQMGQAVVTPQEIDNNSTDPDGDPLTFGLSPAGPFAVGATPVTLTVTDDKGASAQCSATVTVVDTTPPSISCPQPITVELTSALTVFFAPVAADNVPGPLTTFCTPASGSTFPLGTTDVTCTTTDAAGNQASCIFPVTVKVGPGTVALVRRALLVRDGRVEGSVHQLTGEDTTLDGSDTVTGDLLIPGTPSVSLTGSPTFGGIVEGTGSQHPSGYSINLR
ncbi:MAG: HYR domain-containing protein, partial [Pyrinomonadaceae bacterium]